MEDGEERASAIKCARVSSHRRSTLLDSMAVVL